jgi:hypothetical protein
MLEHNEMLLTIYHQEYYRRSASNGIRHDELVRGTSILFLAERASSYMVESPRVDLACVFLLGPAARAGSFAMAPKLYMLCNVMYTKVGKRASSESR